MMDRLLIENLAIIGATATFLRFVGLGPIGRALARRSESRTVDGGRLAELEARLANPERANRQVLELEDRLEFTELLLSRQREADRVTE
jgi:hypothetical protein